MGQGRAKWGVFETLFWVLLLSGRRENKGFERIFLWTEKIPVQMLKQLLE